MDFRQDCRLFTGYKPCVHKRPCTDCPHYDQVDVRIGILSLEAMGAVIRSTCLLEPIRREYPRAHVTWITLPRSAPLLQNNPLIDRVLPLRSETMAALQFLRFDRLYAVDKSLEAGSLAELIKAEVKKGFGLSPDGVIVPFDSDAEYQYRVGLDDQLKFFDNQKPETQQLTESMGLQWRRDGYVLRLSVDEEKAVRDRRQSILARTNGEASTIIGYNTGCSTLFPYKKFTTERAIQLVAKWRREFPDSAICLLGGPEDSDRHRLIFREFVNDPMVFDSPTDSGLRSGLLWTATADLVFSGCSLGMHMAIALKKKVIAWFGVSCAQEVDLYDRGIKIHAAVDCAPCWRRSCDKPVKCYDMVPLDEIMDATRTLLS